MASHRSRSSGGERSNTSMARYSNRASGASIRSAGTAALLRLSSTRRSPAAQPPVRSCRVRARSSSAAPSSPASRRVSSTSSRKSSQPRRARSACAIASANAAGGSARLSTTSVTPSGSSPPPSRTSVASGESPEASWKLSSTITARLGTRSRSVLEEPPREAREIGQVLGRERRQRHGPGRRGLAEVVEEGRRVGVARIDLVPEAPQPACLDPARDERGLARPGRSFDPRDRAAAEPVEQREKALAWSEPGGGRPREFRRKDVARFHHRRLTIRCSARYDSRSVLGPSGDEGLS